MKSRKFQLTAIILALMMIWLAMPAMAIEPEYQMPIRMGSLDEFKDKPIDMLGEVTYQDKVVTGIKLSKSQINLQVGQAYRIKLLVKGKGKKPDFNTLNLSTSKQRVLAAVVVQDGNNSAVYFEIVGVRADTVTMTATLEKKKAKAKVVVKNPANGSLRLSSSTLSLVAGESAQLSAYAYPSTTPDTVSWKSSNSKIASISSDGTVVAKKKGSVTLTAKRGKYTAKCNVRVESVPTAEKYFKYVTASLDDGFTYTAITKYTGKAAHVIVPESLGGNPVLLVYDKAFAKNNYIKSVALPNNLLIINDYAFEDCANLQTVVAPDTVALIGFAAFENCKKLRDFTIPAGLDTMDEGAFFTCFSLREVTIPAGLKVIPNQAFEAGYGLKKAVISEGVTMIGNSAFRLCFTLSELSLPSTLEYIGENAFETCQLLKRVTIPGKVGKISFCAFNKCFSLEEVIIEEGVREIAEGAFANCLDLAKVTIPRSVTTIHQDAFYGVPASNITIYGDANSAAEIFAAEQGHPFIAR